MSSFSRSLMPVGHDWSRPNGPARFGPERCCIRAMSWRSAQTPNSVTQHQEDEDEHGLDDAPATTAGGRSWPGCGRRRVGVGGALAWPRHWQLAHGRLLRVTRLPCPAPRSRADLAARASWSAATPPGPACRADATGTVQRTAPRWPRDLTAVRGADLRRGRRRHPRLHRAGRAARNGSPSCSRPASSSWCQVASTASPEPGSGRRCAAAVALPGRAAPQSPARRQRAQLAAGGGGVGQAQVHVHLVGDPRASTCRSDSTPGLLSTAPNVPAPALPVHERAGLLHHRRDRQHHVGAVGDRAGAQSPG